MPVFSAVGSVFLSTSGQAQGQAGLCQHSTIRARPDLKKLTLLLRCRLRHLLSGACLGTRHADSRGAALSADNLAFGALPCDWGKAICPGFHCGLLMAASATAPA